MSIGVIIEIDGEVRDKRVYSGDTSGIRQLVEEEAAKNPDWKVRFFDDATDPEFIGAAIKKDPNAPATLQEQLDAWWEDGPTGGPKTEAMRARMRQARQAAPRVQP